MLKIKLQPGGKKHAIKYRVVVAEENSKVTGSVIDNLGTYVPKSKTIHIDQKGMDKWLAKGAQLTQGVRKIWKNS